MYISNCLKIAIDLCQIKKKYLWFWKIFLQVHLSPDILFSWHYSTFIHNLIIDAEYLFLCLVNIRLYMLNMPWLNKILYLSFVHVCITSIHSIGIIHRKWGGEELMFQLSSENRRKTTNFWKEGMLLSKRMMNQQVL